MPHAFRQKCFECNKNMDYRRPIKNILLELYLSARTRKRIDITSSVCKGCESRFDRWYHKVRDQFDTLISNEDLHAVHDTNEVNYSNIRSYSVSFLYR